MAGAPSADRHDDRRVAGERETVVYRLDKLGHAIAFTPGRRVLDGETFGRLKSKSEVVTAQERDEVARLHALDKERKEIEAEARRAELLKHNTYKIKGMRLAQVSRDHGRVDVHVTGKAHLSRRRSLPRHYIERQKKTKQND